MFFLFHIFGVIIPTDWYCFNIFQRCWNRQPVFIWGMSIHPTMILMVRALGFWHIPIFSPDSWADMRLWSGWQWLLRYGGANGSRTACELFSLGGPRQWRVCLVLFNLQGRTGSNKSIKKNMVNVSRGWPHLHSFWCRFTPDCDETVQNV